MANGQLRFAIYDSTGQLKSSGNPRITDAGKPAKCLWCHEIGIHLPFFSKTNLTGYYSIDQFSKKVKEKLALVSSSRNSLKSDIDFTKDQDHTKAELLYVTFMEPSAERLAQEWGITVAEVRSKTQGIPTHGNKEFKFLPAELYHRKEIDHFSPYSVVRVADDAREKSVFEPDLKW